MDENNPVLQAADIHNVADEGKSFLDDTEDFVVKGVPLAVASGLYSMYNTGVSLGNTLGGDFEKADLESDTRELDDNLADYYTQHKQGIDLGGFVATSFLPGIAGIKALKVAQSGILGSSIARATGFFKNAESGFLLKANSAIQQETNQVFRLLDSNKIGAIAAGLGEQTLQAASFETGVLVSMNQSEVMNKEDQDWMHSIIYHTPDLLKNAIIGGAVGGAFNAMAISGKLKTMIKLRDKEDFPSLNIPEIGLSDIDEGTKAGIDFSWLRQRQYKFEQDAAAGKLNDRQVENFRRTQLQKETELRLRITEQLADGDADLGQQVWEHLNGLKDTSPNANITRAPEDIATTILGAATKIARLGTEDIPEAAGGIPRVMFGDTYLSERQAKNILQHNKIAPGTFDSMDDVTAAELKGADFELYKDSAGNLRTVPGIEYEKYLKRATKAESHSLVVKLTGDQAGRVTEAAYPVLGDLGKVELSKTGDLLVNKQPFRVPEKFDPVENSPLESNAHFVREQLSPKLTDESELRDLSRDDLPLLEKVYREGFENFHVDGFDGGESAGEILQQLKLEWRQDLINQGHDFDRIARELNVSREFAETGTGEFALSKLEDHTTPQYAKVAYNTKTIPDGWQLRGVQDLFNRLDVARQHTAKASAAVLGEAYNQLPKTNGTMLGINTIPELSGLFRSASEDYGTFGQLMQQVGKVVESITRGRFGGVMQYLAQYEKAIRDDPELTIALNQIVAKIRSYDEGVSLMSIQDLQALNPTMAAEKLPPGYALIFPKQLLADAQKEAAKAKSPTVDLLSKLEDLKKVSPNKITTVNDKEIYNYLAKSQEINARRAEQWNIIHAAKGSATVYDPTALYLPPINTRKYPFVAFVREKAETEFRPVSVLSAPTAADLEAQIRKVRQEFGDTLDVFTKEDIKNFHKLQGDYESGMLLGNSTVDNSLAKKGLLSNFAPRTDAVILDDFNAGHWSQEQALVRNAVELQYAQEFAELRAMGQQFTEFQESLFGKGDKRLQDNPYQRYISTGLGISNYSKYDSVWGRLNSGVEALGSSMFKVWDTLFNKANKGEVDWVYANKEAASHGFRPPYQDALREVWNPLVQNSRVVEPLIAKANSAIATLVLRFDFLNSLVNVMGTPGLIASELSVIRKNIANPDIVGKLSQAVTTAVPGTKYAIPSTMELMTNALSNFVKDDGKLLGYYKDIGAVQDNILQLYKGVVDATALRPEDLKDLTSIKGWTNGLASKVADVGAKITGNTLSERMVRFVAADIMRQLTDIAQVPKDEAVAYINTFVNRVHGNFVASQRPAIFQGAVGHAISLFQTYQFNVMQNMLRYVERNDKLAMASLLGMQNTLFGLQGNPAFYLLNSYIGNQNRDHVDLTSGLYATVGKDVGNWLMYGLGANALKTNLYNRGDLTPRYVTVLPTNITDSPAISISAKAIGSMLDTMGQIWKGASPPTAILNGIAHSGFNRPLSGVAQLALGYRTTTDGNLLTAYNDLDSMTVAAKVMGGEELNRAVAIDAWYRNNAYMAKNKEDITAVGKALKTKLYKNQQISSDDVLGFMKEYARAGGQVQNFNKFMVDNIKHANTSQINKIMETMRTPAAKNLATIMGGISLDDFRNTPAASEEAGERTPDNETVE